ncbi:MAG: lasso peptide biosynthesis B2 protein, partial [Pseudomonadota bacterium]
MTAEADSAELRWREKWLAFRVGLLIPLIEFCMRRTSFRGTQRVLLRLAHCLPPYFASPVTLERAVAIGELVELGNTRYSLYRADCLTLSLALQYTINRLGGEANICLGVRTTAGQFEAHAWVE